MKFTFSLNLLCLEYEIYVEIGIYRLLNQKKYKSKFTHYDKSKNL